MLVYQWLESQFCCIKLFLYFSGSGWVGLGRVGSGRVDGNSDNRANSAQFQVKLPTGDELGNNKMNYTTLANSNCKKVKQINVLST